MIDDSRALFSLDERPAEDAALARRGELARRILRAAVPATLATGLLALYPAISDRVVAQFGRGFTPKLVAIYVASLVGLYLADAWVRDRRLLAARLRADQASTQAEHQRRRSEELRLVLDVAAELNGEARLESALLHVLERLRASLPFATGYVFLRDSDSNHLARRGLCPLTAAASESAQAVAAAAMGVDPGGGMLVQPARDGTTACPIHAHGAAIGAIVLEGVARLEPGDRALLATVADRLGEVFNGRRLLAEIESKERSLRRAYRELRAAGTRLASSRAVESANSIGRAVTSTLAGPVERSGEVLRRLDKACSQREALGFAAPLLAELRGEHQRIEACLRDLADLSERSLAPRDVCVNDALVAALDLAMPDLKRAGIEVRLSLAQDLPPVHMDEDLLLRVFHRVLRRARARLRRQQDGRRLEVESRPYGRGVKILIRDNATTSGRSKRSKGEREPGDLRALVRSSAQALLRSNLVAHGIGIRSETRTGTGRTTSLCLRGVRRGSGARAL